MKILALETSAKSVSAAVTENGAVLASAYQNRGLTHSVTLMPLIDGMLCTAGLSLDDIGLIAAANGPGSFTGLRIGVSFAKGLCYGLQKPLVAVGSLDALAEVAREDYEAGILSVDDWDGAYLCPMVDARRMEVYAQVFDSEGRPQGEVSAEVVDEGSFAAFRGQGCPFVIFGSGARKCADVLPDAVYVEVTPSARGLARLAQQALDEGRTEDIAYFEPFYLKDFVVTTSRKKLF